MTVESSLQIGWSELNDICLGEFGEPLQRILAHEHDALNFKRVGRLMAVWVKYPFAQSFAYNPDIPANWAKSLRAWEIRGPADPDLIEKHHAQYELLALLSSEWERPIEYMAEFNIFILFADDCAPQFAEKRNRLRTPRRLQRI
jgi:hypothetical protein